MQLNDPVSILLLVVFFSPARTYITAPHSWEPSWGCTVDVLTLRHLQVQSTPIPRHARIIPGSFPAAQSNSLWNPKTEFSAHLGLCRPSSLQPLLNLSINIAGRNLVRFNFCNLCQIWLDTCVWCKYFHMNMCCKKHFCVVSILRSAQHWIFLIRQNTGWPSTLTMTNLSFAYICLYLTLSDCVFLLRQNTDWPSTLTGIHLPFQGTFPNGDQHRSGQRH